MPYREDYAETMLGEHHRHLAIRELDLADQYFWNLFFETNRKDKLAVRNSTNLCLKDPILMVEMMPKSVSSGHPGERPSSSADPPLRKHTKPSPNDPEKPTNVRTEKYPTRGMGRVPHTANLATVNNTGGSRPRV